MRNATRQLPNRVHLLRSMQLLFKTTAVRNIVGADNDPAKRAKLLGRRRNNSLDHLVALGSLVSVGRSCPKACSEMGLRFPTRARPPRPCRLFFRSLQLGSSHRAA